MRALSEFLFLTFVLSKRRDWRARFCIGLTALVTSVTQIPHARSAIETPTPDLDAISVQGPEANSEHEILKETLDISVPKPASKNSFQIESEYFYPYRRDLAFRFGQAVGTKERNGTRTPSIAGIQFGFTTQQQRRFEAGADLFSDGTGSLQFSKKWIFSRTKFRPYFKAGGGLLVNPEDRLVIFVKYENYRAIVSAGFEWLVKPPQSIKTDIEVAVSPQAVQAILTLAYVWAW